MEEDKKSITDILRSIEQNLTAKGATIEEKKFKIPMRGKLGRAKIKKGFATYVIFGENKNVEFRKYKITESTTMVDSAPRLARPEEIFYYKGKPIIFQPIWSTKPISAIDNYQETLKEKYGAQGYKLLLNRMLNEVIKEKAKISGMIIFIVFAALVGLGVVAYKSGWLN